MRWGGAGTIDRYAVSEACVEDLLAIEDLTAKAVHVAFDHPDLTEEQRNENDWIVSIAQARCLAALHDSDKAVFVGKRNGDVVGFLLARQAADDLPEIGWLMVDPAHHGSGLASALLERALAWIGAGRAIKLTVLTYNARAIAFYRKFGFEDAGPAEDDMKTPRLLMIRPRGTRA